MADILSKIGSQLKFKYQGNWGGPHYSAGEFTDNPDWNVPPVGGPTSVDEGYRRHDYDRGRMSAAESDQRFVQYMDKKWLPSTFDEVPKAVLARYGFRLMGGKPQNLSDVTYPWDSTKGYPGEGPGDNEDQVGGRRLRGGVIGRDLHEISYRDAPKEPPIVPQPPRPKRKKLPVINPDTNPSSQRMETMPNFKKKRPDGKGNLVSVDHFSAGPAKGTDYRVKGVIRNKRTGSSYQFTGRHRPIGGEERWEIYDNNGRHYWKGIHYQPGGNMYVVREFIRDYDPEYWMANLAPTQHAYSPRAPRPRLQTPVQGPKLVGSKAPSSGVTMLIPEKGGKVTTLPNRSGKVVKIIVPHRSFNKTKGYQGEGPPKSRKGKARKPSKKARKPVQRKMQRRGRSKPFNRGIPLIVAPRASPVRQTVRSNSSLSGRMLLFQLTASSTAPKQYTSLLSSNIGGSALTPEIVPAIPPSFVVSPYSFSELNAGDGNLNGRIKNMADIFEKYSISKFKLVWESDASDTTSGSFYALFDKDPNQDNSGSLGSAAILEIAAQHPIATQFLVRRNKTWDLSRHVRGRRWLRPQTPSNDPRTIFGGLLTLFSNWVPGIFASTTQLGRMYVEYAIKFDTPISNESQPFSQWTINTGSAATSTAITWDFSSVSAILPAGGSASVARLYPYSGQLVASLPSSPVPHGIVLNEGYSIPVATFLQISGYGSSASISGNGLALYYGGVAQTFDDSVTNVLDFVVGADGPDPAFVWTVLIPADAPAGSVVATFPGWSIAGGPANAQLNVWTNPSTVFSTGSLGISRISSRFHPKALVDAGVRLGPTSSSSNMAGYRSSSAAMGSGLGLSNANAYRTRGRVSMSTSTTADVAMRSRAALRAVGSRPNPPSRGTSGESKRTEPDGGTQDEDINDGDFTVDNNDSQCLDQSSLTRSLSGDAVISAGVNRSSALAQSTRAQLAGNVVQSVQFRRTAASHREPVLR